MATIRDVYERAGGRPSGFDYMRIILAFAVILFHSILFSYVTGLQIAWDSWARGLFKSIVPMFFCLSGFLVAGSALRSKTLIKFLGLRVCRIYPALAVEITLSALILGPLITTSPLGKYFSDSLFFRYLLNITGDISFYLPGVFANNPYPSVVNSQLWTIKFELLCYITMSVLFLIGKNRFKMTVPAALIIASVLIFVKHIHNHSLNMLGVEKGPGLLLFYLCGVLIFILMDKIPHNRYLCLLCAISAFLLMAYVPGGDLIAVYPLSYVTVYLGTLNPRRIAVVKAADLSYGVYLYGAVIQQTLIYLFPWSHHWYLNFLLTIVPALGVAWFSWNVVEKPALQLKSQLDLLERAYLRIRKTSFAPVDSNSL